ncbi:hypothetical protein B0H15DRAFT_832649, partial [Mycena belliarum]
MLASLPHRPTTASRPCTSASWFLNVHAAPPYHWQRCQALLYPHLLLLSWIAPGGGRGIVGLDLLNCTTVQSTSSASHPNSQDDVGSIAARLQSVIDSSAPRRKARRMHHSLPSPPNCAAPEPSDMGDIPSESGTPRASSILLSSEDEDEKRSLVCVPSIVPTISSESSVSEHYPPLPPSTVSDYPSLPPSTVSSEEYPTRPSRRRRCCRRVTHHSLHQQFRHIRRRLYRR